MRFVPQPAPLAPAADTALLLEDWTAAVAPSAVAPSAVAPPAVAPAPASAGLLLPNTTDVLTLPPPVLAALRAGTLRLVVLQFPKWTDGRAYSQAHLLRTRLAYCGELRATGEVLADMLPQLQRCGFDAVQLRADQKQQVAQRALDFFDRHYQPDAQRPAPVVLACTPEITTKSTRSPTQSPAQSPAQPARPATAPGATQLPGATAVARHARKTAGHDDRVRAATALLHEAADEHAGRIVQTTSLGIEGMVITDLIARHRLPIQVATLDTGALHAQTLALLHRAQQHYGLHIDVYRPPAQAVLQFVQRHGDLAMRASVTLRQDCCAMRKIEPMERLLAGHSAWVTGLRREQSQHRQAVAFRDIDAQQRAKFCPLADWTLADVWQYAADHDMPYNPLHDAFHPSIGCAPCTRAVALGEDERAGRWWWEAGSAAECGLHAELTQRPNSTPAVMPAQPLVPA